MPPALATKSGAQTIPRSASWTAIASAASWLLAAPAITRHFSSGTVSSSSTPPSAHGASTSTSAVSARVGVGPGRAELVGERALALVDVGGHERGARLGEQPGELAADAAEPDDRDAAARQRGAAEGALAGDLHRALDAERGPRARVAGAAGLDGEAGDVVGRLGDHGHVAVGGADVLGRHVGAAERADGVAEVQQHVAAVVAGGRRVAGREHDHALAAAEREPGHGGLEGHRARQAQRVADRGARVAVGPHAAAAERRAAGRRVDGDDRVEARAPSAADEQRLVVEGLEVAVDGREVTRG